MIKFLLKLIDSPFFKFLATDFLEWVLSIIKHEQTKTVNEDTLATLEHLENKVTAQIETKKRNSI